MHDAIQLGQMGGATVWTFVSVSHGGGYDIVYEHNHYRVLYTKPWAITGIFRQGIRR